MRQAGLDTKATPTAQAPQNPNLLILGLAAGTTSDLYTKIYGAMPITGVELDPQIIEVGRRYFAMNQPNLNAIAADGRRWLAQQPPSTQWEIILVDAYRPPYIPFHLTTVEFFALVRQHLRADGVLAINVGRTASNYELVEALAATAGQIFPSLYRIDEPGPADNLGNSLLVATVRSSQLEEFERKLVDLVQDTTLPAEFRHFAEQVRAQTHVVQIDRQAPVFTDDRAPVERLIHGIIWSFLAQSTPN
jgi:spermidine synthase